VIKQVIDLADYGKQAIIVRNEEDFSQLYNRYKWAIEQASFITLARVLLAG
jgi:hypothetical protein